MWLPFLLAFVVAFLTALSYLELVGKYPRAAGAALYTQLAFGIRFFTIVNVAVLVLRRRPVAHRHFRAPRTWDE